MPSGLHIWHHADGWRYWHHFTKVPDGIVLNPWYCAKYDDDTDERLTESEMAATKEEIISICALHVAEGD